MGNRPLNATDPTGLEIICCSGGGDGGGGYCDASYENCDPGCDPVFGCGGGPGGPPPGYPPPPGNPPGNPPPPQRTGGVWPGNETTGLPTGLNISPLQGLGEVLGLLPGLGCGDTSGFVGNGDSSDPGSSFSCAFVSGPPSDISIWKKIKIAAELAAIVAVTTAGGVTKEFLSCNRTSLQPTNAHCEFKCQSKFDVDIGDYAYDWIGMGELTRACGPIVNCPNWVQVNTNHIQLFIGIGLDLGGSVTRCIP